jgi:uncharacterized phiE125 gp8 family phage protein
MISYTAVDLRLPAPPGANLIVITPPAKEPISLEQAKRWLREDSDDQDDVIEDLITVCRLYGENYTRRAYVTQTLELSLPSFPWNTTIVELPRPPLQSVISVKYVDTSGNLQLIDPLSGTNSYQVDTRREPGLIKPTYLNFWPATRNDFNAVQIRYVVGYPDDGSGSLHSLTENVPKTFKTWMRAKLATLYENRERFTVGAGGVAQLPRDDFDGLLDHLVVNLF